jgi:hypothetical protein
MVRIRKRHQKAEVLPAGGHHSFVEPWDPRLGLALGGSAQGGRTLGMAGPVAMTMQSLGRDHCAAPGCGKPREDPVHWPAESEASSPDWR